MAPTVSCARDVDVGVSNVTDATWQTKGEPGSWGNLCKLCIVMHLRRVPTRIIWVEHPLPDTVPCQSRKTAPLPSVCSSGFDNYQTSIFICNIKLLNNGEMHGLRQPLDSSQCANCRTIWWTQSDSALCFTRKTVHPTRIGPREFGLRTYIARVVSQASWPAPPASWRDPGTECEVGGAQDGRRLPISQTGAA